MVIKRTTEQASVVSPKKSTKDNDVFEQTLRPKNLAEYVGQGKIKEHLL
ncbi:Holliday junction branch migration DNA helicase RuvB, partial [Candidatus Peregrinibacteria bacterium]|nr:Holliday junction branch migration DNA helicase RuvB [Candidatus Peregrinibacteria bacterium]